ATQRHGAGEEDTPCAPQQPGGGGHRHSAKQGGTRPDLRGRPGGCLLAGYIRPIFRSSPDSDPGRARPVSESTSHGGGRSGGMSGGGPSSPAAIRRSASAQISSRRARKASCSSCASSAADGRKIRNSTSSPEPAIRQASSQSSIAAGSGGGISPARTIRKISSIPAGGTSL